MIKTFSNFLLFLSFCTIYSCTQNSKSTTETSQEIPSEIVPTISLDSNFVLENITSLANIEQIEQKFGKENIKKDTTIAGPEGTKLQVTVLNPNSPNQVILHWDDKLHFKKLHSAVIYCDSTGYDGKWHSKAGLQPGMQMSEVLALNAKPFTISGFGWDYAGHIVSWEGGKLDNKRQTGRFSDFGKNKISDAEQASIAGDTEFNVSLEAIKKLNPTLSEVTVFAK